MIVILLHSCTLILLLLFFLERYKTQKRSDKAVIKHLTINILLQYIVVFSIFDSIPDQYGTQEIRDFVVSLKSFLIIFCPDKYVTPRMCDKVVHDSLAFPKILQGRLTSSKIIKRNYTVL